ncbi:MAG: hypothetical protein C5B47_07365 [Verrucomicrobia bacterium]|nr:MAG: hypothetical protein C5B47_07365 [Verrucomicrobiota bacterium]
MNIESFTSASMEELVTLAKRREDLLEKVKAVEADITRLLGGSAPSRVGRKGRPPKAQTPQKRGRKGNRGQKPGALKERILEVLEHAGENGITVADIASKLGVPKANVHVWFSTTGKRLGEVRKIEPGRFRFHGAKRK